MEDQKLLIQCHSESLLQHVTSLKSVKRFMSTMNPDPEAISQVLELEKPVAMICYVDDDLDKRLPDLQPLLEDVTVVFLSNGNPYPNLDQMMRSGAMYHFRAPFDWEAIDQAMLELYELLCSGGISARKILSSYLDQFGLLIGSSAPMRELYRSIQRVADSDANVLILGESGTGKELVAKTIHLMSSRKEAPYIAINCGALSPELVDAELFGHTKGAFTGAGEARKGLFDKAHGGTLFLDEITEMPLEQQVKLLRVLETGEYRPVGSAQTFHTDVRIVAASNRDPAEAVQAQLLREDLYYRLSQFPIDVPALREREGDIKGLAVHFLSYRNKEEGSAVGISQEALETLTNHTWPGNVRELKHTIERAYILAQGMIQSADIRFDAPLLDSEPENQIRAGVPLEEIERQAIEQTLEENQGNKTESAEQLGISVKTLYNKLEKYKEAD
ncbi:MAG: sigma-54-dependent Fis family transcriptional regulator [Oleiphilus sp.]|nr:MAG: sigma-54-dependent Fis family transcriptional regulator [Oleiphilus sp.]